jgi:serine acetyltransferase
VRNYRSQNRCSLRSHRKIDRRWHEVTLGGTGKERGDRHPKVRNGVLLCAGAKVLGNIEIGRDAKVGAGSVVLRDVPPRATVAGVPARIVGWSSGSVPALEMDQPNIAVALFSSLNPAVGWGCPPCNL